MLLLYGYKIDLFALKDELNVKDATMEEIKEAYPDASKNKLEGALFRENQHQLYWAMECYLSQTDKFETTIKAFKNGVLYIGWNVENDARTDGVDPSIYTLEVVTSDKLLSKYTTTKTPRIFLIDSSSTVDRNKISPDLGPLKVEEFPPAREMDLNMCGTMEYIFSQPPRDPNTPLGPDFVHNH